MHDVILLGEVSSDFGTSTPIRRIEQQEDEATDSDVDDPVQRIIVRGQWIFEQIVHKKTSKYSYN